MKKLKISIIYIFLIFIFYGCCAMNCIDEKPKIPKNQEQSKSRVLNYGDKNLKRVANKFKNLKNSGFAIKFFGDSHIASDDLAAGFRDEFFKTAPVNSIGFAMPILPKYYNHNILSYRQNGFEILDSRSKKHSDFPLCGIVAKGKSGSMLELDIKSALKMPLIFEFVFKSDKIGKILRIKEASGKEFILINNKIDTWQKKIIDITFPIKIEALDDIKLARYIIKQQDNARFADICGINGAFSSIYQTWSDSAFSRDFTELNYDIIALEYGTNDAFDENLNEIKFYENLKGFVKKIKQNQPNAAIILISPPTTDKTKFKSVQNMIKKLAIDEKILFYDIEFFMNLNGSKDGWIKQGLSKKDVHLTRSGYKKVGDDLANELKKLLLNL